MSSNFTFISWRNTTAGVLIGTLPLQDFSSAISLVESYLSDTGGWNPDDVGDPTGLGEPVSGETPEQAAINITNQQLNSVYQSEITGQLTFKANFIKNLGSGLSESVVLSTIESEFAQFIENQFDNIIIQFESLDTFTGTVISGPTTAAERVLINNLIVSGDKLINPKAIALSLSRNRFSLDNTYNVSFLYTQTDKELVILIEKYTSTAYTNLDLSVDNQFIISLDSKSYHITTGVTKSR
jgi:hypothetical protein